VIRAGLTLATVTRPLQALCLTPGFPGTLVAFLDPLSNVLEAWPNPRQKDRGAVQPHHRSDFGNQSTLARRDKPYASGGRIRPLQNGFVSAGDYLSAAAFPGSPTRLGTVRVGSRWARPRDAGRAVRRRFAFGCGSFGVRSKATLSEHWPCGVPG
jgi:hypothetical protein